jgi:hypothetical protein
MKELSLRALVAAPVMLVACAAQAQAPSPSQSPDAPTWYMGAAGGASHVSLACADDASCDRSGTAWKIYGGFQWANHTGGELIYEDFGRASAGGLGALGVTDATVRPRALGLAAVWAPELVGGLSGKVKVGVSTARARLQADAGGVAVDDDRRTFAHWWLAAGLAWRLAPRWDLTADWDWTRAGVRNDDHKQTYDVGALSVGAAWHF